VSIGAAGPPLKLSVNPLAVLICLPEVCRKLTQAPLAKGVSGSGSQTTVIETVINCRPVNVGDAPMVIVFVAAFAGVTVAATSNAPIPMAVAILNLIAPSLSTCGYRPSKGATLRPSAGCRATKVILPRNRFLSFVGRGLYSSLTTTG